MGSKNIATIIASGSLILIVGMVFAYTKANVYSFFFGFLLCIMAEFVILIIYCFSKVQKAYSDSNTIKLTESTWLFIQITTSNSKNGLNLLNQSNQNRFIWMRIQMRLDWQQRKIQCNHFNFNKRHNKCKLTEYPIN